jgi:myo-inositol 2-dehydrogenase / D-chiro-inositol 1-dehydrogenase
MGADHGKIVAEDLPRATLQVVCDMDAGRARRVADLLGALDASSDAEATVARADVDALIVASSTSPMRRCRWPA